MAGLVELAAFFSPVGPRMNLAETVIAGETLLVGRSPHLAEARLAALTPAEREIAARLVVGSTNAGIAARRGASPLSVQTQVSAILRKVGAASRADVAAHLAGAD